jgi:hypothetical protein
VIPRGWVLVTDGGNGQARSTLAAVRGLARAGYRPAVTVSAPLSSAAASRHCGRPVPVPTVTDPEYEAAVKAELAAHPYLTVLAASDAALLALGEPVEHLVDKGVVAERAPGAGLVVPPTRRFGSRQELLEAGPSLDYPVVVKPALSFSPVVRVGSAAELAARVATDGPVLVQPFLDERLRAMGGVAWRGRLAAAVHQRYLRTWPPDTGTASAAETVEPDLELEAAVLRLLDGFEGVFQAQLAGPYLLDLNPRVYGSLPLAVAAGANLPAVYCDLLRGVERDLVRARPGVFYRWVEGDLRHLAAGLRDGSVGLGAAVRALRPRRGAAHSTESLSDPGPALSRLRFALRRSRHRGPATAG